MPTALAPEASEAVTPTPVAGDGGGGGVVVAEATPSPDGATARALDLDVGLDPDPADDEGAASPSSAASSSSGAASRGGSKSALIGRSPLEGLKQRKRGTWVYMKTVGGNKKKQEATPIEGAALYSRFRDFIRNLASLDTCVSVRDGIGNTCTCMHHLRDREDAELDPIVSALLNYQSMDSTSRKAYQMDRMQFAEALSNPKWNRKMGIQRTFLLPIDLSPTASGAASERVKESYRHRICIHSWCRLHNLGRDKYGKMKQMQEDMQIPQHKNIGNNNRQKGLEDAMSSARNKLKWAEDSLACPFATRVVRNIAGEMSLRNDESENGQQLVFLPPNTTKRGLWLDWIRGRGWDPVKTCKHRQIYAKKDEWSPSKGFYKTEDEARENGGKVAKGIITFEAFRILWLNEFPHLRVRARGEDTCTDCFKIKNRLRHLINKKAKLEERMEQSTATVPDNAPPKAVEEMLCGICVETVGEGSPDDDLEEITPEEFLELISKINALIKEAEEHVRMHVAQREESDKWIKIAREDFESGKPLSECTVVKTMDMSQNGTVPTLGADQCGDFYYMSPKTEFIFGVCDNGRNFMNVYIWGEDTADRGADNIVSCLYWDLKRSGIIDGTKVKHLVIIADNCPGQNKNFCVLKFCAWLVEAGWAEEVTLHFLIKGHTKNDCDVKFNILKRGAKNVNIFDEADLDAAYTKDNAEYIDLQRVPEEKWRGFTLGLSSLYRDPKTSTTLCNHIFRFGTSENATTYTRQVYRDAEPLSYDLMPSKRSKIASAQFTVEQRASAVSSFYEDLQRLPKPGMSAIKENDLGTKVADIVPPSHPYFYPKPSEATKEKEKKRKAAKSAKASEKAKAKRAKIEQHNQELEIQSAVREKMEYIITELEDSSGAGRLV